MAIRVSIRQLTQQAFGLGNFPEIKEYDFSKKGFNTSTRDQLGRLYFLDVTFYSATLDRSFKLPNEPLIRVAKKKNIVETVISGNEDDTGGVVIEQVNKGNYSVDIRGIILNEKLTEPQYPQDQVTQLVQFADLGEPLSVKCSFLETLFGIKKLVIRDYSIDEMQGRPYSQLYTLNCMSYQDFYAERSIAR